MNEPEVRLSRDGTAIAYRFPGQAWWTVDPDGQQITQAADVADWRPMTAAPATPQASRCPECGARQNDVHRLNCQLKQEPPLSDGSIPYGGACGVPGCRYADVNVRHVHGKGKPTP